jgi:2-hydroxychromene-2-carboxylate isomerase
MIQTVEIFYSFSCPYSYLAIDRLTQLEGAFEGKVLWQPFSTRLGGKAFQGQTSIAPDRASYIREDVARLAKKSEMPLVMPADWPENEYDVERCLRGAVVAGDLDLMKEYNVKVSHCWWGEGVDPSDQSFFIQLCDDLDTDANEFSGRINSADTRERVRGIYKRGRKLQIFDTPTILIGEERFVGIDRIDAAFERLKEIELAKSGW